MKFNQEKKALIKKLEAHQPRNDGTATFYFGPTRIVLIDSQAAVDCMIARLKAMKGPYDNNQPCAQQVGWDKQQRFAKRYRIHPTGTNKAVQ